MQKHTDDYSFLLEAMVVGSSQAIEDQEARGQQQLVHGDILPKPESTKQRAQLEEMGIVFGEDADNLFVRCTLPEGWKKQATDHSMWSDLLDNKGRKRASIFYKAAFCDRDAHMGLVCRYGIESLTTDDDGNTLDFSQWGDATQEGYIVVDKADGSELYRTPLTPKKLGNWDEIDALHTQAVARLDEHYPDWKNPAAYWD